MTSAESARPALRRDADRRLLLGVCAGLARVLDTDPAVVRAAAIVIGLFTGPLAIVAYVATAVVVPRDDGRMLLGGHPPDRRESLLGWAGIVVACSMLLAAAPRFDLFWIDGSLRSPLLVVAVVAGVIVLARANRDRSAQEHVARAAATPGDDAAPAGDADETAETATSPADADATAATAVAVVPTAPLPATRVHATDRVGGPEVPGAPDQPTAVQAEPAPRGRSVFLPIAGALLAAAGTIVVLESFGAFDLTARTVAIMLGAGAVISGVTAAVAAGRRGTGAILTLGIVLALGAAGVAAADDQLDDGVGQRVVRPATAAELKPEYRLGVGQIELDLRDTKLPAGTTTPVKADLGVGEVRLRVAPDVRVETAGSTEASGTLAPAVARPPAATPVVRLDAHTDIGAVQVVRDGS